MDSQREQADFFQPKPTVSGSGREYAPVDKPLPSEIEAPQPAQVLKYPSAKEEEASPYKSHQAFEQWRNMRNAVSLSIMLKTGRRFILYHSSIDEIDCDGHELISIRMRNHKVYIIMGFHLGDLADQLSRHNVAWIREGAEGPGEASISQITVQDPKDDQYG